MRLLKAFIRKTLIHFFLLLIGYLSLSAEAKCQDHGIYQVKFDFQHSRRIPNHSVSVELQRSGDKISVHVITEPKDKSEKWKRTKQDYTFELTKTEFDKIVGAVKNINCTDIASGLDFDGLDGTVCEISFGSGSSGISYKVWSPDYDTSRRSLKVYLDACHLILQSAKLDPEEIL